jgi:hypothetical protein
VVSQFFKRKSLGRRPKAHTLCTDDVGVIVSGRKKRGPVPGAASSKKMTKTAAVVGDGGLDELCPSILKPASKVQRANWGVGETLQRLTEAVKDWDSSTGSALDTTGNKLSLRSFSIAAGISASTLMEYVHMDNKRSSPGDSVGRPPLLTARNQDFIRNFLARKDRVNEGANYQEAVDFVQEKTSPTSPFTNFAEGRHQHCAVKSSRCPTNNNKAKQYHGATIIPMAPDLRALS